MNNKIELTGIKHTKQRLKIAEILSQEVIPLTAENIFIKAKATFPTIALTTIYRNLELLVNGGQVNKIMCIDGIARYEYMSKGSRHSHFLICKCCNKAVPLKSCPIKSIENGIEQETGFQVTGHNLEIYGYCKECIKNKYGEH